MERKTTNLDDSPDIQTGEPVTNFLNRREMLARLGTIGLILAAPNIALAQSIDRPPGTTNWREIHELNDEFMRKVDKGDPIALLIGTTWCSPCEATAEWWKKRSIGPFQPYDLIARTDDEWEKMEYHGLLGGIKEQRPVPLMLMIHGKDRERQKYRHETVLKYAFGYDGCTQEVAKWLNQNNY